MRTSQTDPLRVDWVEAPAPRRLGITIAPGKRGPSALGEPWERGLDDDLASIVAQGGRVLVCLMEQEELARLGIAGLIERASASGLVAVHEPIVDGGVPTLERARAVVARMKEAGADPIVVHCRGGLGRSGAIAGCFLRALGVSADEALRRLVKARGASCPENDRQRAFVRAFSPSP
jgi:protein-tyrosine phosphatase